jgi:predicted nucleic acid-binding protein
MRLVIEDALDARWTEQIHTEWTRNLLRDRPDLTAAGLRKVCDLMNKFARNAVVTGFEEHIETLQLPDPNDRHVLAAAIEAKASAIVTFNLRDFPKSVVSAYKIRVLHPDAFFLEIIKNSPEAARVALKKQRAQLVKPVVSQNDFILQLKGLKMPLTAVAIQEYQNW